VHNKNVRRKKKFFDLSRTESLKDALGRYMKESGLNWMLKHKDIVTIWNETVGEEIKEKTRIKGFRNGVLQIDVFSPVLKSELEQFYKDSLVDSIKQSNPETKIRKLKFFLAEKKEN
jgi:hypothetical protein